jgi:N-acetylmuramoyl-L-alanine amidase
VRDPHFHRDPRREAAFVVLKSLDLPSVLVEAGYVSNADDVRSMTDKAWRARFATTLARAIEIFLLPSGHRIAGG